MERIGSEMAILQDIDEKVAARPQIPERWATIDKWFIAVFCPTFRRGSDGRRPADARLICIRAPFVGPVRHTRLAP